MFKYMTRHAAIGTALAAAVLTVGGGTPASAAALSVNLG